MFQWDAAKAEKNLRKHGIAFGSAVEAFDDPWALAGPDLKHSTREQRRLLVGGLQNGRVVTLVYTRRLTDEGETNRIISARPASAREREAYRRGKAFGR